MRERLRRSPAPGFRLAIAMFAVCATLGACAGSGGGGGGGQDATDPADAATADGAGDPRDRGASAQDAGAAALDTSPASKEPELHLGGSDDEGHGFVDWSGPKPHPPMIRGPQGAQHVWVSIRVHNVHPKKMEVWLGMEVVETGKSVYPGQRYMKNVTFKDETSAGKKTGWYLYQGMTAVVGCPCRIHGMDVKVSAKVKDVDGVEASAEVIVAPTWDDPKDCNEMNAEKCEAQGPKKL